MPLWDKLLGRKPRNGPLPVRDYVERYADFLRARYPEAEPEVHHGPTAALSHVQWTTPDDVVANQYFGNWYARYLQSPTDLDALIEAQHDDALAIGGWTVDAADQASILPVIKPASWLETRAAQLRSADIDPSAAPFMTRPLAGDLLIAYVRDTDESMDYVGPGMLEKLQLKEADLHDLALRNLERFLPSLRVEGGNGRYAARLDRNYDASMILLLDRWRDRIDIAGTLAIALPARDEVLICARDDEETVASLAVMAAEIRAQAAYDLTDNLFEWRDGWLSLVV
jgi:uncharacterized protein YtpQ (UPF0354 family)